MKKTKKALASLAIASMALTAVPFNAFAAGTVPTRIAGVTAEQTAVQIADQTGYTGTAILASSTSYGMVDALTAGPLAASLKAPILLTGAGSTLDAATKAELTKLAVKTVYVSSGTAVIKQGVLDELVGMGITVVPLGGVDRSETSVNIAKKMTGVTKVAVANSVPDALSIAAVAAAANEPILLTNKDALPSSVSAYIASAGVTAADVIGGTGVISDAVVSGLPGATRHAGMTAYDTNNQVIQDFASSLEFGNVFVANGVTGIDALAGAPLAAQTKSAIVLTDGKTVPQAAAFTYSKSTAGSVVTALGGEFVVPESVRAGVAAGQVTPVSTDLKIVSVSALDDTNRFLEVDFSKPVSGLEISDISIAAAATGARYGVQDVKLSSNGLAATLTLYAPDANVAVLQFNTAYNVTVTANGQVLKAVFNRPFSFESRVTAIDVANSKITVVSTKDATTKTLKVLDPKFNYEGALGELVQVWYNSDNELVKSQVLTTSAKVDAIEVTDGDTIKLVSEDKKYDTSSEQYSGTTTNKFTFYVNGEKENIADYVGQSMNFAKVGFDKSGDIAYVSAYTLKDFLIFDSVDQDEVVGINGSGSFDASDATIVKDGVVVTPSDLKKGDIVFYNIDANGGDGYAEVYNHKAASGEIDSVYNDAIEVGGETYDYNYTSDYDYNMTAVYINEDGDVAQIDKDAADTLQAGGDVTLYTDHAGNLIYVAGDTAAVATNNKYAALTDDLVGYTTSKDKVVIDAVDQDGNEQNFDMYVSDLDTITVGANSYDIDNGGSSDYTESLIPDGAVVDADTMPDGIRLTPNAGGAPVDILFSDHAEGSLVKLHLSDTGSLKELEFLDTAAIGADTIESGDKYVDGYKLQADTLMFNATDAGTGTDPEDYVMSKFGDYKGEEIDTGEYVVNSDNEVTAIWYSHTKNSDYTYDEAVITKVLRNTDGNVVSITGYIGGALKTIAVDELDVNVVKGDIAVLQLTEDNDALVKGLATETDEASSGAAGDELLVRAQYDNRDEIDTTVSLTGVDVGNKKVTTSAGTFVLAANGLVIDDTDTSDISTGVLTDLRGETKVTVVRDSSTGSFAKFFVIKAGAVTPPATGTAITAPYIFSIAGNTVDVDLADSLVPASYSVVVYNGTSAVATAACTTTNVENFHLDTDFSAAVGAGSYTIKVVKNSDGTVLATKDIVAN